MSFTKVVKSNKIELVGFVEQVSFDKMDDIAVNIGMIIEYLADNAYD